MSNIYHQRQQQQISASEYQLQQVQYPQNQGDQLQQHMQPNQQFPYKRPSQSNQMLNPNEIFQIRQNYKQQQHQYLPSNMYRSLKQTKQGIIGDGKENGQGNNANKEFQMQNKENFEQGNNQTKPQNQQNSAYRFKYINANDLNFSPNGTHSQRYNNRANAENEDSFENAIDNSKFNNTLTPSPNSNVKSKSPQNVQQSLKNKQQQVYVNQFNMSIPQQDIQPLIEQPQAKQFQVQPMNNNLQQSPNANYLQELYQIQKQSPSMNLLNKYGYDRPQLSPVSYNNLNNQNQANMLQPQARSRSPNNTLPFPSQRFMIQNAIRNNDSPLQYQMKFPFNENPSLNNNNINLMGQQHQDPYSVYQQEGPVIYKNNLPLGNATETSSNSNSNNSIQNNYPSLHVPKTKNSFTQKQESQQSQQNYSQSSFQQSNNNAKVTEQEQQDGWQLNQNQISNENNNDINNFHNNKQQYAQQNAYQQQQQSKEDFYQQQCMLKFQLERLNYEREMEKQYSRGTSQNHKNNNSVVSTHADHQFENNQQQSTFLPLQQHQLEFSNIQKQHQYFLMQKQAQQNLQNVNLNNINQYSPLSTEPRNAFYQNINNQANLNNQIDNNNHQSNTSNHNSNQAVKHLFTEPQKPHSNLAYDQTLEQYPLQYNQNNNCNKQTMPIIHFVSDNKMNQQITTQSPRKTQQEFDVLISYCVSEEQKEHIRDQFAKGNLANVQPQNNQNANNFNNSASKLQLVDPYRLPSFEEHRLKIDTKADFFELVSRSNPHNRFQYLYYNKVHGVEKTAVNLNMIMKLSVASDIALIIVAYDNVNNDVILPPLTQSQQSLAVSNYTMLTTQQTQLDNISNTGLLYMLVVVKNTNEQTGQGLFEMLQEKTQQSAEIKQIWQMLKQSQKQQKIIAKEIIKNDRMESMREKANVQQENEKRMSPNSQTAFNINSNNKNNNLATPRQMQQFNVSTSQLSPMLHKVSSQGKHSQYDNTNQHSSPLKHQQHQQQQKMLMSPSQSNLNMNKMATKVIQSPKVQYEHKVAYEFEKRSSPQLTQTTYPTVSNNNYNNEPSVISSILDMNVQELKTQTQQQQLRNIGIIGEKQAKENLSLKPAVGSPRRIDNSKCNNKQQTKSQNCLQNITIQQSKNTAKSNSQRAVPRNGHCDSKRDIHHSSNRINNNLLLKQESSPQRKQIANHQSQNNNNVDGINRWNESLQQSPSQKIAAVTRNKLQISQIPKQNLNPSQLQNEKQNQMNSQSNLLYPNKSYANYSQMPNSLQQLQRSYQQYARVLLKGMSFLKYGRHIWFKPQLRTVRFSEDLSYFYWEETLALSSKAKTPKTATNKYEKKIFLFQIERIQDGRKTKNFQRFGKNLPSDCEQVKLSFSIICDNRTIDLQALSLADKEEWCHALSHILYMKSKYFTVKVNNQNTNETQVIINALNNNESSGFHNLLENSMSQNYSHKINKINDNQ